MSNRPIFEVKNLSVQFGDSEKLRVIHDISFSLNPGETMGLVGESGSGKSVTGLTLMGLLRSPGKITHGEILLEGENIRGLSERALSDLRGRKISMILQNPSATLNPVVNIGKQMIEAVLRHERVTRRAAEAKVISMLEKVGITAARDRLSAYPHQFSGGMRQRIAIATALINHPKLLIADEPTTALDVTIQAQIISEVQSLCREVGTAVIWITHDLSTISAMADRLAIMYAGRIVEIGQIDKILANPQHHYTQGLIGSIVSSNRVGERLRQIPGLPPMIGRISSGCAFRPRCAQSSTLCESNPPWRVKSDDARALCHHPLEEMSYA